MEPVPFRLTRNLLSVATPFGTGGVFAHSILAATQAVSRNANVFENQLLLFVRDDLLSWHSAKTQPRPESEQRQLEKQLGDRIAANVRRVTERLQGLQPFITQRNESSSPENVPQVNEKVYDLIEAATTGRNLCQMSPTWMPWL